MTKPIARACTGTAATILQQIDHEIPPLLFKFAKDSVSHHIGTGAQAQQVQCLSRFGIRFPLLRH